MAITENKQYSPTSSLSTFSKPSISKSPVQPTRSSVIVNDEETTLLYPGASPASFFATLNNEQPYKPNIRNFNFFIKSRINYLQALDQLGENWISSKSIAPNRLSIDVSIDILKSIEQWYSHNFDLLQTTEIPKIIMGPIPTGGITLEIAPKEDTKIYVTITNNEDVEIEVDESGYFTEVKTTKENYRSNIVELISKHGVRNNYSGWRNAV
jgi:hypothetical protein